MVDTVPATLDLDDSRWLDHTAYGFLKRNPRYRRRCVFRKNVAFGMRPVVFKFRPTILVPQKPSAMPPYNALVSPSGGSAGFAVNGVLGNVDGSSEPAIYYHASTAWRLVPMPWMPTMWSNAPNGSDSVLLRSSAGNVTNLMPNSALARVNRWHTLPLFGMFHGMQPNTAMQWPRNLRQTFSFDLEFRKPRQGFNLESSGQQVEGYYREWGAIPNTADPNIL